MNEIQRARLVTAAAETVKEVGYPRMTVAQIVSRAGVSRKTFYDAFADREDCFLALLEETTAQAASMASDAYYERRQWRAGIRSALWRLLVLMEREPALARLWVVEARQGGQRVLEQRARALGRLAKLIAEGHTATNGRREPPGVLAEGVLGGVLEILHTRLVRPCDEPLPDLLGPLMYMIVLPYLGETAARSELNKPSPRPTPSGARRAKASARDPLQGLNVRLTYRTVRVLVAIGADPGASNREVAGASGIVDQGQISKLLSRLAGLELVENHGLGQEKGGANAWQLTKRGERLVRAARPSTHTVE